MNIATGSFIFRFADVEVHEREYALVKAGESLTVEPKAFRVLLILLHNPKKLIPKEELLNSVWGDAAVTENSLTRSIALLRNLLGDDAHSPRFIETVATVGYRFLCPVESVEDPVTLTKPAAATPVIAAAPSAVSEPAAPPEPAAGTSPARMKVGRWVLGAAAMLAILLAVGFWYLSRPLPLPRITGYTQITHDGRYKWPVATDGNRLYFHQFSPNTIGQVGVNGGEIAQVPIKVPGLFAYLCDISSDGSTALVGAGEEGRAAHIMWLAPILGGAATRLGEKAPGVGSKFSPDGASVVYATPGGDVYVVRTDGTQRRKLATVGSLDQGWFGWSPDGRVIRFTKGDQLWEMSSDGSGLHQLLPDWHEQGIQCCGSWTPDGHLYLFHLWNPSRPGSEIWALEEGRRPFGRRPSEPIRLTTGPIAWSMPIPSKDGKKIFAAGVTLRGELSRIDPKTGAIQPFLGGISGEFVSFSNDGKSIAYVSYPDGILWKADRDGSNRVKLSGPPDYPINPRWSPDSKQILFNIDPFGVHAATYLAATEGGAPRKLLPDVNVPTGDANWSPDSKKILFDWGMSPEKRELRILDLDSREMTTIPGSKGLWSSRWSPDGRYIAAFASPQTPNLRVFDFRTGQWTALPSENVQFISFSRDSRYIYFERWARDQGVFRIPVTGGKEERLVDMTDWHMTGYFGHSMTLDPTDAPLVLRDTGTYDIYALTLEEK